MASRKTVFKFCTNQAKVRSLVRELTTFNALAEKWGGPPPGLVEVRSANDGEPPHFIELRYVEGGDLREWIAARGKEAPFHVKMDLAIQASRVLAFVHGAGVVHRDIKPSNFLVDPASDPARAPTLHLTDFGLGQTVLEETLERIRSSHTGLHTGTLDQAAGTFLFIAPELLREPSSPGKISKRPAPSADVYALGVTLFQLFCGDAAAVPGVNLRGIDDPVLREDLEACLEDDPTARVTAVELTERLTRHSERTAAVVKADQRNAARHRHRSQMVIALLSLGFCLSVVFGVLSYSLYRHSLRLSENLRIANEELRNRLQDHIDDLQQQQAEPSAAPDANGAEIALSIAEAELRLGQLDRSQQEYEQAEAHTRSALDRLEQAPDSPRRTALQSQAEAQLGRVLVESVPRNELRPE